jgi:hypothetical protein
VLVRQRFDLLLLDETALGGLLEQALGRREVMQMNRLAQLNPFRLWAGPLGTASSGTAARSRYYRESPKALLDL